MLVSLTETTGVTGISVTRGVGRPRKPDALTPAERQRRAWARKKAAKG